MSSTDTQDKRWHFQTKRIQSAEKIEYKNEIENTALES